MVVEYQSADEIYTYYETKMKIMSNLEKRHLEELDEANDDDEEIQEALKKETPSKKVNAKNDTEIHNKIFEEKKNEEINLKKDIVKNEQKVTQVMQIEKEEQVVKTINQESNKGSVIRSVEVIEVVKEVTSSKIVEEKLGDNDYGNAGSGDEDIGDMPKLVLDDDE